MTSELGADEIRRLLASVPWWYHAMEFPHGIWSPGENDPRWLWSLLPLADLRGKRVLDVGARDGFFSFACERLGAEVVAVDHARAELTGFPVARRIYGSRVEYVQANVYDLTPEGLGGTFDVVLFLGMLYHLRHPLLALDRLRDLCRERLILESWIADAGFLTGFEPTGASGDLEGVLRDLPLAQFLPIGRFHPDSTNKWLPNLSCLLALLGEARFEALSSERLAARAIVVARPVEAPETRRWIERDRGLREPDS